MNSFDQRCFALNALFISAVLLLTTTLVPTAMAQAQEKMERPTTTQQQQVKNWLQSDANKDGKLSKEETQGFQKRFFDRNDGNQDGWLDEAELKSLANRLARNQANGKANQANQDRNRQSSVTTDQLKRKIPAGVTLVPDIEYRKGHQRWKLDLLVPSEPGTQPRPAIVFVHGGGWRNGDKRKANFIDPAIEFASKGYVCISVNYRFVPEVSINDIVGDVKCAVRWLRAHADKYNVDPERFGAYGNSAGAHLVSMLGICPAEAGMEGDGPWQDHSSMVQAVCASATPTSFMIPMNDRIRSQLQNQKTEAKANSSTNQPGANQNSQAGENRNPDVNPRTSPTNSISELARKKISPAHYVTADAPPFLLLHDESDKTVSVEQSKTFVAALKKVGAKDITFKLYDDKSGHGVMQKNISETGPLREAFFDRTLRGNEGRPTISK